jgi:NTP pyrophosphatase (non-canonical NTP hydrolase)
MDLKELTQQMNDLVRHHGWYEPDSPKQQTARNLAISLSLEASEVLEHFQWSAETKDPEGLRGELADVALYLLQLASVQEIDLEQAILDKIEANWDRSWLEERDQA